MDLKQIVSGVVLSKTCSVKPDKDSVDKKTVTLSVKFNGVTLGDVFEKAVSGAVIQWQNGPGRKGFDLLKDGQVIEVEFKSPGRTQIDPREAYKARLMGMNEDERKAEIHKMLAEMEAE